MALRRESGLKSSLGNCRASFVGSLAFASLEKSELSAFGMPHQALPLHDDLPTLPGSELLLRHFEDVELDPSLVSEHNTDSLTLADYWWKPTFTSKAPRSSQTRKSATTARSSRNK